MAMNDPIADLLTRIRNAAHAGHDAATMRHSKLKEAVARILQREGFVNDVQVVGEGARTQLVVSIKYDAPQKPVFNALERVSRPGRRVYVSSREIKPTRQGMGVAILTTPKGVMTDSEARRQGVGGEVMCTIW
jgi:small subunit ribosomal protein S8